mgnify:CR=1 FL=1
MNKYRILQFLFFLLFCTGAGLLLHHLVIVPERNQKNIEALKAESPEGEATYEIVSVTKADSSMLLFTQVDFPGHHGILSYVDQTKRMGLFETEVSQPYYEQTLTLVTCSYEWKEARTVVVAVKKAVQSSLAKGRAALNCA